MSYRSLFETAFKVLVVVALGALIALQMDDRDEIVYVDTVKLISSYKGVQPMRSILESKSRQWQANLDSLQHEAEAAFLRYERDKQKSKASEVKLLKELADAKNNQYMSYQEATRAQYQKEEMEVSKKILDRVNDYLKRYGEQKGYTIILAATHYGNIAYADQRKDVTKDVLVGLNAEFDRLGK